MPNFPKNYFNLWGLVSESAEKDNLLRTMTEALAGFMNKIASRVEQIAHSRQEIEQQMMRLQVDLKLSRRDTKGFGEKEMRQTMYRDDHSKKLKEKVACLDFELKKEKLKSEQLEEQILEQGRIIAELKEEKRSLEKEKEEGSSFREAMEFKVKRLKEELEVAHIIKEQNLADKMKYIMNW